MFLQKFNGRLFTPISSSETGRYNTFLARVWELKAANNSAKKLWKVQYMPQVISFPQLFVSKTFVSRWCYSTSHLIISYQMKDDKLEPLKVIYIIFCLDTVQINFFFLLLFRYHFKSKTAAERHKGMFHRWQKEKTNTPAIFKCDVCGALCQSLSTLNRHKKTKNHTKRSRKSEAASIQKTTSSEKRKTKQRTINDLL